MVGRVLQVGLRPLDRHWQRSPGTLKRRYDAGDVVCIDDALEEAQADLSAQLKQLLDSGHFPIVLGGGHEVAYGSYQGLAAYLADVPEMPRIGIINFDAHLDMRLSSQASSGTPFAQISRECLMNERPFLYLCAGVAENRKYSSITR